MATKKEPVRKVVSNKAVEKLSDELHEYHVEVTQTLATMSANCKHCHDRVDGLDLQINGEKPENKDAPGLKAVVNSLKQSRDSLARGVHYAWAVIIGLGGLLASMFTWKHS